LNVHASRFPLMDSIRAIALIATVGAHASFFMSLGGSTSLSHLRFDFGVRVFFMISGFLLYRPFVRARLRDWDAPSSLAYFWRRLLRIVPAYWVALTAIAIWLGISYVFSARGIPTYYGFAQIYQPGWVVGGLPQAWSLCVEVAFYVFLPLYAALLRRVGGGLRVELLAAAGLFGVGLAYKLFLLEVSSLYDNSMLPWHLALPEYLDYFAIGMALAALSAADVRGKALDLIDRRPWVPWLGAAVLFLVVSKGIGLTGSLRDHVSDVQYLARHYLYGAIALGILLPAVFGDPERGLIRRLLGWPPLLWIGLVSYGAFLYHFALLGQLKDWGFGSVAADVSPYLWFPVALAGALAIAAVSWYCFERPVLSLKRLVPARRVERGEATLEPVP
jgi:peptidoglycan/LPS O-acetylase OafA/YrhL